MSRLILPLVVFFAALLQFVVALPQFKRGLVAPPPPALAPPTPPAPPIPSGIPDFTKLAVFGRRDSTGEGLLGYVDLGVADSSMAIAVQIGLKFSNQQELETKLLDMSDPASPNVGQFLTADELLALVSPPKAAVDLVSLWIKTAFNVEVNYNQATFTFSTTIQVLNTVLQTEFHVFQSPGGEKIVRTLTLNIPELLMDALGYFTPGTSFDADMRHASKVETPSGLAKRDVCDQAMSPACLQQLYGIPKSQANLNRNNILSVPGFIQEYANRNDLSTFLNQYRPDASNTTFQEAFIDGGVNPQNPGSAGVEANLDIQYTAGLASGVPIEFLSSGSASINAFINVANRYLSMAQPPSVVSISYGFNENQLAVQDARRLCDLFGQLGARGVSVIVASGDGGVAGSRPVDQCGRFIPTFPASCPFVTAVGATENMAERGADLSAGGFSEIFQRPNYQTGQVGNYLQQLESRYQGRFNPNGRAFPDVAAIGERLPIFHNGSPVMVSGTSASAPIFASIVALLNEQRLSQGKPPLGFLNLRIYAYSSAFNDINQGSNPSCGTPGFPARPGWDPVTGVGSPSFARLSTIFISP